MRNFLISAFVLALSPLTYGSQICSTNLGTASVASVPTTTSVSTVSAAQTVTVGVGEAVGEMIMVTYTKTVNLGKTITKTTPGKSTTTLTTTSTVYKPHHVTVTTTFDRIKTAAAVSSTITETIESPSGFIPAASGLAGKVHPQYVACVNYTAQYVTVTKTNAAATVYETVTNMVTVTHGHKGKTTTTTVPKHIITATAVVKITQTTTQTVTRTVTSVSTYTPTNVAGVLHYRACDADNMVNMTHGGNIASPQPAAGFTFDPFPGMRNMQDCCIVCVTNGCGGAYWHDNACYMAQQKVHGQQEVIGTLYLQSANSTQKTVSSFTISNGAGIWAYGGVKG